MQQRGNRGFCVFPGYNWCGPGCSGPGAPINHVDAACREHDLCYRRHRNRCICDQHFMNRLRPLINPYTQEGRHARTLYQYMKLQTVFTCAGYR
ncbi:phospholipase [Evansella halocellulosilytica]|uniref:phospholipase n=1 Tax=Evansella halocellulosilytica TaxID=2011013 RepID=UPI000BB86C60|nr:phospholipase [Evansella halocellulosilytica]